MTSDQCPACCHGPCLLSLPPKDLVPVVLEYRRLTIANDPLEQLVSSRRAAQGLPTPAMTPEELLDWTASLNGLHRRVLVRKREPAEEAGRVEQP